MDVRQGRWEDSQGRQGQRNTTRFRALRFAARCQVEGLESRQLLTGAIADVGTLSAAVGAVGAIAPSSDGQVWFSQGSSSVSKLAPDGSKIAVALPSGNAGTVADLVVDSSGNAWYSRGNMVGKVVTSGTSGTATEFPLSNSSDKAGAETIGPDGNVWVAVTTANGQAIAKVDPSGGVTEVPLCGVSHVNFLTAGPDGNLWFVDGNSIAKTTLSGQVTHYTLPNRADNAPIDLANAQLVAGAGNKLWFLGLGGISSITTDGVVKTYPTPSKSITSLAFAPDGNLWFTFLPSSVPNSSLAGTPGAVVGRMTQDGQITMVNDRANGNGAAITSIAATKDGNLWLGEGGTAIARLSASVLPAASNPIIRPTTAGYVSTDAAGYFNGPLVSFAPNTPDTASQVYKASIDWGDGIGSVGTVMKNVAGDYTVYGLHTYNFPANTLKGVIVTIQDAYGNSAKIFNTVKIKPVVPTAPATTPSGTTSTGTTPTGTTSQPGTPQTAGSVKDAILQVLKSGGTNAQAIAAGEQFALQQRANRMAGVVPTTSNNTNPPNSTALVGTATPKSSTQAGRHRGIVANRAAGHRAATSAHPRGPLARRHRS